MPLMVNWFSGIKRSWFLRYVTLPHRAQSRCFYLILKSGFLSVLGCHIERSREASILTLVRLLKCVTLSHRAQSRCFSLWHATHKQNWKAQTSKKHPKKCSLVAATPVERLVFFLGATLLSFRTTSLLLSPLSLRYATRISAPSGLLNTFWFHNCEPKIILQIIPIIFVN